MYRSLAHVAVIMDGNGRWAKQHGKMRVVGHHSGVKAVRNVVEEPQKSSQVSDPLCVL